MESPNQDDVFPDFLPSIAKLDEIDFLKKFDIKTLDRVVSSIYDQLSPTLQSTYHQLIQSHEINSLEMVQIAKQFKNIFEAEALLVKRKNIANAQLNDWQKRVDQLHDNTQQRLMVLLKSCQDFKQILAGFAIEIKHLYKENNQLDEVVVTYPDIKSYDIIILLVRLEIVADLSIILEAINLQDNIKVFHYFQDLIKRILQEMYTSCKEMQTDVKSLLNYLGDLSSDSFTPFDGFMRNKSIQSNIIPNLVRIITKYQTQYEQCELIANNQELRIFC